MSNKVVGISPVTFYDGTVLEIPQKKAGEVENSNIEVRHDPQSPKYHYELAKDLKRCLPKKNEEFQESAKTKILEKASEEFVQAGELYEQARNYSKAYKCFKKATLLPVQIAKAQHSLAKLSKFLGYKFEAAAHFDSSSHIYRKNQDFQSAYQCATEALALDPDNINYMIWAARALYHTQHQGGNEEKAKMGSKLLTPLLDKGSTKNRADIYYYLGRFYKDINPAFYQESLFKALWKSIEAKEKEIIDRIIDDLQSSKVEAHVLEKVKAFVAYLMSSPEEKAKVPKDQALKICEDLLKEQDLAIIYKTKASILAASPDRVTVEEYNAFLARLPNDHPEKKQVYSMESGAERGHPNGDGALVAILESVLNTTCSWDELHARVYDELYTRPGFSLKFSYFFKLSYRSEQKVIEVGESDQLLFFALFHLSLPLFQKMLGLCTQSLCDIQDSQKNTLAHIAAFEGKSEYLKAILEKAREQKDVFRRLINARNLEGTNPLGMVFLKLLVHERIVATAKLFIKEPLFKINDYLNNYKGIDYRSHTALREIGGFTCLHRAIVDGNIGLLKCLSKRNRLNESPVNMLAPTQNAEYHMTSPKKLVEKVKPKNNREVERFLKDNTLSESSDESGDSSDEQSPAYQYTTSLKKLARIVRDNIEKSEAELNLDRLNNDSRKDPLKEAEKEQLKGDLSHLPIVHFHGVPFMKGQYTNEQRRFVARKLLESNELIETPEHRDKERLEQLKAIRTRTATATARVRTLYEMCKGSPEELSHLDQIDKRVKAQLSKAWMEDPETFMDSLSKYIYNFAQNPIEPFWEGVGEVKGDETIRYRFPISSLSKAPDHAVQFGIGNNVEGNALGEEAMDPKYRKKKPRHRLAGLLYVTFHSVEDISRLFQTRCAADTAQCRVSTQLGRSQIRIDHQLEVSFFGGVEGKNVKVIIPIVYPNLSKKFKKGYHDVIWGIEESKYKSKVNWDVNWMKRSFVNFVLQVVKALTRKEDQSPGYISHLNELQFFPLGKQKGTADKSKAQQLIREGNTAYIGSPEKDKISIDDLGKRRIYHELFNGA